jgi:hypothetical protein
MRLKIPSNHAKIIDHSLTISCILSGTKEQRIEHKDLGQPSIGSWTKEKKDRIGENSAVILCMILRFANGKYIGHKCKHRRELWFSFIRSESERINIG